MSIKRSREELKRALEARQSRDRQALEAKHRGELQDLEDRHKAERQLLNEIWPESGDEDRAPAPEEEPEAATAPPSTLKSNGARTTRLASGAFSRPAFSRRGSVADEVQIILDEISDELAEDEAITQHTVRERYVEKFPGSDNVNLRSQISHTLRQLSDEMGPLELVQRGAGSRPSRYRMRKKQREAELLEP